MDCSTNAMEFKHFWYSLLKRGIVANSNSATSNNNNKKKSMKSHARLQRKLGRDHTRTFSVLSVNYLSWAGRTDKRTHFTHTLGTEQEKISWFPKIEGKFTFLRGKAPVCFMSSIWNSPLNRGKSLPCSCGCRLPCLYKSSLFCQGRHHTPLGTIISWQEWGEIVQETKMSIRWFYVG